MARGKAGTRMTREEHRYLQAMRARRNRKYNHLDDVAVAQIRKLHAAGWKGEAIALALGRSQSTISRVINGKSHTQPRRVWVLPTGHEPPQQRRRNPPRRA
jgi:IS30 family transposase